MASDRIEGQYGPGTFVDKTFMPVPDEAKRIMMLLASKTPGFTQDQTLLDSVTFDGADIPIVPGAIKSQAVTAAIHGMVGIVGHEILRLRGFETDGKTAIDVEQVAFFLATPGVPVLDGKRMSKLAATGEEAKIVPDFQVGVFDTPLKIYSIAIYPTATPGVWYQLHGSMSPIPVLELLGLDGNMEGQSMEIAYNLIKSRTETMPAHDLHSLVVTHGLAGDIVRSPEEWRSTMMGKALARHPLINYTHMRLDQTPIPVPFPSSEDKRPLAGIKVLEMARIIAAPVAGCLLAAMGADVVRVQAKDMNDLNASQMSLMAGKRTFDLDIRKEADHKLVQKLIESADVIIQGYRLKALERHGFGLDAILDMAFKRGKGIVHIDENCYGPDGYYAERPGWQQIADACSGVSYVLGRSLGRPAGEGLVPSLPISDMTTGVIAALEVMMSLRDRAKQGGSYHCHAALTAFDCFQVDPEVGLYSPEIVKKAMNRFGFQPWSPESLFGPMLYKVPDIWRDVNDAYNNENFYAHFDNSVFGKDLKILAPIQRYTDPDMCPRWSSPPVPFCHDKVEMW